MAQDNGTSPPTNGHATDGHEAVLQTSDTPPADPAASDAAAGSAPSLDPPPASTSASSQSTDTQSTVAKPAGGKTASSRPAESKQVGQQLEAAEEKARETGKSMRGPTPRSCHSEWCQPAGRRDPVEVIIESSVDRVAHLLPIRYGRMQQSAFAFYRGAAAIMAADLAGTPTTGLRVQLCGDCHLLNFGVFATPERNLIFDVNDFDETLPGPWEWDVKRLAASFVIAGRHNGFRAGESRAAALAMVRSYGMQMARFAGMRALDVWYERLDVEKLLERFPSKTVREQTRAQVEKASRGPVEHALPDLVEQQDGQTRIRDNPPLIYHPVHAEAFELIEHLGQAFQEYRRTLPDERRVLLDRYHLVDRAVKVVGVGSVGTRCGILLLLAGPGDPLLLQVKEARESVLEPYVGKSIYPDAGQRVVVGQRLIQAASDLFLGWTHIHAGRHFYVRQARDVKVRPLVEIYRPKTLALYGEACGWVLARAHARSGDPKCLAAYLGTSDRFNQAIADFAESYADQNERDYQAFVRAIREGRVIAAEQKCP
ncbi:MAG TPA: DUF2252 domain-containing protein [Pirellulales bacterium]|jgi:uncharacterized protein (DUF2252 family)|nr:DUF2252 domain-containing protein [Pirellulales bacterium]